MGQTADKL